MKSWIFEKLMDYYMVITCSIFFFRGEPTNFRGEATNFRGAMSNFRGEATNFRGAMSNFRGAMSNFRGAMSNFRGEATNFCGEATGGNQWPLHKWIYYINEVKTHILVTHRRSQEKGSETSCTRRKVTHISRKTFGGFGNVVYLCSQQNDRMKQIAIYIAAFLIVCACTSRGRYTAMRHALDSINTLNRTDRPFTPADVEPYVGYFDLHGNSNDRMLAHYLLGRAYHEQGEAPMALRSYQEAVTAADTTDEECDYAQLSRVCGQMAFLFYQQGLYNQVLPFNRKSVKYAWIAKDTLLALGNYEQETYIQMIIGNRSKSMAIIEDVAKRYTEYGHPSDAAISLGVNIKRLIDDGNYEKAKEYMDIYESKSGFFDSHGNIEKGREQYYETKGFYYLNINMTDSAEYYFRKELREGKDFYNQHSAALGLMKLYRRIHIPDSTAKYAVYAYNMNDSLYAKRTAKELGRIQSMYNYSRYQEIAYKESAKANLANIRLLLCLAVLLAVLLASSWLYIARKNVIEKLSEMTEELNEILSENNALKQDALANSQLIEQNNRRIKELEKKIGQYERLAIFGKERKENNLTKSADYIFIKGLADKGEKLSGKNWEMLLRLSNEYYPGFTEYALSHMQYDSRDFKICHLLRLHFKAGEIANMLGVTPPYISKSCTEILYKLFDKKGSSKELYQELRKI